jgi:hypothetical protein
MRIQTGPILGATDTSSSTVWLEWSDAPEPPKLVLKGQRPISAELISTHPSAGVFRLSGLKADTDYTYRFAPEASSRPGPFHIRTSPVGLTNGSIAVISCNRWQLYRADPTSTNLVWRDLLEQISKRGIQAVFHVGDQIYADEVWDAITNAHLERQQRRVTPRSEQEKWCKTNRPYWVEAYRNLYRDTWNPAYPIAEVLASVPNLMIGDDHDIHDGYGSRPTDFWLPHNRVAEVAFQVYREYQHPLNPPLASPLSRSLPWTLRWPGIEVFAMDLRSDRKYDANPSRIVGDEQWKALELWKDSRPAHDPGDPSSFGPITFLIASTPPLLFGKTDSPLYALIPDLLDDLRDQWVHGSNTDELEKLLRFCDQLGAEKRTRVVILSGDIHIHHLIRCSKRPGNRLVLHQVTSSPVANTPVGGTLRNLVYEGELLKGATHAKSAYDGEIVKDTLLSNRGYAIVEWKWSNGKSKVGARWRVLGDREKIEERGPFPLN